MLRWCCADQGQLAVRKRCVVSLVRVHDDCRECSLRAFQRWNRRTRQESQDPSGNPHTLQHAPGHSPHSTSIDCKRISGEKAAKFRILIVQPSHRSCYLRSSIRGRRPGDSKSPFGDAPQENGSRRNQHNQADADAKRCCAAGGTQANGHSQEQRCRIVVIIKGPFAGVTATAADWLCRETTNPSATRETSRAPAAKTTALPSRAHDNGLPSGRTKSAEEKCSGATYTMPM